MNVQTNDVSEDARTLLRLISRLPRLSFTTADMLALHPKHREVRPDGEPPPNRLGGGGKETAGGCVAMEEREITRALGELSQSGGWLGAFTPGRYVFRALTPDMPEDGCNPDGRRSGREGGVGLRSRKPPARRPLGHASHSLSTEGARRRAS
jgi:hypothetical protein